MKVYLASPFFCEFERLVKSFMRTSFKNKDITIIDPEESGNFSELKKGESLKDYELAKMIFDSNIQVLKSCDSLVFPKYTTDLGTLFELGYALKDNYKIFVYDFLHDKLEDFNYDYFDSLIFSIVNKKIKNSLVIEIKTTLDAVLFGVLANDKQISNKLIYKLGSLRDNLMLAAKFPILLNEKVVSPVERVWKNIV